MRSGCDGMSTVVEGSGEHDLDLPVGGPDEPETCRVELAPNFRLEPLSGGEPRSVVLELLAFRAEAPEARGE